MSPSLRQLWQVVRLLVQAILAEEDVPRPTPEPPNPIEIRGPGGPPPPPPPIFFDVPFIPVLPGQFEELTDPTRPI
jgi:hypothetical protein